MALLGVELKTLVSEPDALITRPPLCAKKKKMLSTIAHCQHCWRKSYIRLKLLTFSQSRMIQFKSSTRSYMPFLKCFGESWLPLREDLLTSLSTIVSLQTNF